MDDEERLDSSTLTRDGEDVKKVLQHGYAQLESALSEELARRDEEKRGLIKDKAALSERITKLIIETAETASLKNENVLLKAKLDKARRHSSDARRLNSPTTPVPGAPEIVFRQDIDRVTVSAQDYAELATKFDKLKDAYLRLQQSNEAMIAKAREAKRHALEWQEWAKKGAAKKALKTGQPVMSKAVEDIRVDSSRPTSASSHANAIQGATAEMVYEQFDGRRSHEENASPNATPRPPPKSSRTLDTVTEAMGKDTETHIVANKPFHARLQAADDFSLFDTATIDASLQQGHPLQEQLHELETSSNVRDVIRGGDGNESEEPVAQEQQDKSPSSSQTTSDGNPSAELPTNAAARSPDDEDDTPVVVSARSLKRKRPSAVANVPLYDVNTTETSGKRIRIKDEPQNSPDSTRANKLPRTETYDLDQLEYMLNTPQRRRRYEESLRQTRRGSMHNRAMQSAHQERSNSLPPDFTQSASLAPASTVLSSVEHVDNGPSHQQQEAVPTSEDRANTDPLAEQPRVRHDLLVTPKKNRKTRVLQALSPNTRQLPRTSSPRANRNQRRGLGGRGKEINTVMEDGDSNSSQANSKSTPPKEESPVVREANRRLQGLLEGALYGSAAEDALATGVDPQLAGRPRPEGLDVQKATDSPSTVRKTMHPIKKASRKVPPIDIRRSNAGLPNVQFQRARLRDQPLSILRLSDFKINPAMNDGLDYAFNEVVRDQTARKCRPGCTNPACCGTAFKALAAAAGPAIAPSRGLWDSSQERSTDDEVILKDYLGEEYFRSFLADRRSGKVSAQEWNEVVRDARTKSMADKYGRHRHAFERAMSPPGYWNADFPTTQEIERDREEAKRRELAEVESRAREARRGGRWLFRDE